MVGRQEHREIRVMLGGFGLETEIEIAHIDTSRYGRRRGLDVDVKASIYAEPRAQPITVTVQGMSPSLIDRVADQVARAREMAYAERLRLQVGQIRVYAGPPGLASLCAAGDVMEVKRGDGADHPVTLLGADGRVAWSEGFVTGSSSGFTDPTAAAVAAQQTLGIDPSTDNATTATAAPDLVGAGFAGFASGTAIFGDVQSANRKMMSALGRRAVWVRGQLRWASPDLANIRPAVILRDGYTLLSISPPGPFGVRTAHVLFNPLYEPSRQVLLQTVNRATMDPYPFRVDAVTHTLSSYAAPWYSDITIRPSPRTAIDPFAA